MPRYRYDKDMECLIEIRDDANWQPEKTTKMKGVISDIEPYRAMGSDIASENKRPIISGRRQHREYLSRNGYIEVGNDYVPNRYEQMSQRDRVEDIKRVLGE